VVLEVVVEGGLVIQILLQELLVELPEGVLEGRAVF